MTTPEPAVPRSLTILVIATATCAVAVTSASLVNLALAPQGVGPGLVVTTMALAALFVASRLLSVQVTWKRHRFGVSADEALLLAGVVLLPPGAVVLAVLAGIAAVEALRRHEMVKAVFNVASYVLAAAAAAAAYVGLVHLGAHALLAAPIIPVVASLVAYFLLSQVFALLEMESPFRIFRERFGLISLVSSVLGLALGFSFVGLHTVHPLSPLALAPLALLAWLSARTEARQDRELTTRRALARMTRDLVGCQEFERIADSALTTCVEVFDCARVEFNLAPPIGERVDRARDAANATPSRDAPVVADIVAGGVRRGSITVTLREGARPAGDLERELAGAVAAAAAAAVEAAGILRQLDDARRRLDAYLRASEDATLVVDGAGALRFVNNRAFALLRPGTRAAPERQAALLAGLAAGDAPKGAGAWEAKLEDEAGRVVVLEVRATPVPSQIGESEVLVVARDVTEKRRLEAVEARQREVLARSERLSALGTLVAGVAHEVNNPLMYMRGNTDLVIMELEAAASDEGAEVDLDAMVSNLKRVVAGIDRLEKIAKNLKSVAQGARSPTDAVDVRAAAERAADIIGYGLPPGVGMTVDLAPDLPSIRGDAGALEQALLNVMKNAAEAMEGRPGEVRITGRAEGALVVIEVSDQGPGIPADVKARLFTPFFTTKHEGTGLGLALVHSTIRAHGGEITVESTEGRGTTFTVRLPTLAADEAASPAALPTVRAA